MVTVSLSSAAIDAPSDLEASASSRVEVRLSWNDNSSDEQGFAVELKVGTGDWGEIARVTANATNYLDTVAIHSGGLLYRVRAYNAAGVSAYSNVGSIRLPGWGLPWLQLLLGP